MANKEHSVGIYKEYIKSHGSEYWTVYVNGKQHTDLFTSQAAAYIYVGYFLANDEVPQSAVLKVLMNAAGLQW